MVVATALQQKPGLLEPLPLTYDARFRVEGRRPENWRVEEFLFPDTNTEVMVRERAGRETLSHKEKIVM